MKVLLDHLNCSKASIKMTPEWAVEDAKNADLGRAPVNLDFSAPKALKILDIQLEFTFGEDSKEVSISLPNPRK